MGDEIELAAKAIGESVGVLAEQSGALGPVKELSDWIKSFIHFRRQPSLAKQMMRAADKVRATGIPPHAVDDKHLRAILEAASLEDEPTMQERWENLLANALTADEDAVPPVSFAAILAELEPIEARAMDFLLADMPTPPRRLPVSVMRDETGVAEAGLDNLERLGLIRFLGTTAPSWADMVDLSSTMRELVVPTALGVELVIACRPPQVPSP